MGSLFRVIAKSAAAGRPVPIGTARPTSVLAMSRSGQTDPPRFSQGASRPVILPAGTPAECRGRLRAAPATMPRALDRSLANPTRNLNCELYRRI